MAERKVDQQTANDIMQDSFGLSADDLGMNREDSLADLDLGDEGLEGDEGDNLDADNLPGNQQDEQDDQQQQRQPQQREQPQKPGDKKPDDLSVTHTPPKDEFDHGKPKFDKKGNVLGSKGQIIATAGREARMYTSLHAAKEKNTALVTQANSIIQDRDAKLQKAVDIGISVAQKLTAMTEIGQLHTKAGLNDQDLRMAVEFASAFKQNPIEGLKKILTRAAADGIDLTTLGLQPGGFDSKSLLDLVRAEINNVTQPIRQRTEQETVQQQQQRVRDEAVTQASTALNQFLTANSDARQYLPIFEEVYKNPQFQNMSLGEVWARIQLNLLKNEQAGNRNPQNRQQQRSPNRQQPRVPTGRGNPPDSGGGRITNDELAPVSTSYEDILRGVLTTAGVN